MQYQTALPVTHVIHFSAHLAIKTYLVGLNCTLTISLNSLKRRGFGSVYDILNHYVTITVTGQAFRNKVMTVAVTEA